MSNLKKLFSKCRVIRLDQIKPRQLCTFVALLIISVDLAALGLGNFTVDSNLEEPLKGQIELRVSSGDDLSTLQLSIASQDEFDNFGVEYSDYLENIELTLNTVRSPVIIVSSDEVIINEPFIHFLIKVEWAGGSFLREYTALIDPPVYATETPRSVAAPKTVGTDQAYADTSNQSASVLDIEESDIADELIEVQSADAGSTVTEISDISTTDQGATDARYGPVERGESLSVIAVKLQQRFPDLNIYQIMKVVFEENREAFINDNINGLLSGSVLNISDINAIREVDLVESRNFFSQQLREWNPDFLNEADDPIRIAQDEYQLDEGFPDDPISSNDSSIETTDSFQVGASTDTGSFVFSAQGDSSAGEVLALRQEIADLETSLASSRLENDELTERISILEGQLAEMNRVMNLGIENAELAAVESTLAQANNSDAETAVADAADPISSTPPQTSSASSDVVSFQFDSKSWIDSLRSAIVDSGLWQTVAVVVGFLVIGFGFLMYRRRRIDEEFEISMLSIVSHSQSNADASRVSTSSSNMMSSPEKIEKGVETDKDTSFLTVYSDSGAVVQADQVDPIAEADVYIAYGRNEQAEEVLLDGVTTHPNRDDIKVKLLGLYHKTQNIEGFERIAEELYANRKDLDSDTWQEVCKMGKEVSPSNPLFDLLGSDIETADYVEKVSQNVSGDSDDNDAIDEESQDAAESQENAKQSFNPAVQMDSENESIVEFQLDQDLDIAAATDDIEIDTDIEHQMVILAEEDIEVVTQSGLGKTAMNEEFSDSKNGIHLVNFDENRSEISQLDDVEIGALERENNAVDQYEKLEINIDAGESAETIELDLESIGDLITADDASGDEVTDSEMDDLGYGNGNDDEGEDERFIQEISDLEIDADYDEARTQYELAKVFVDLGDQDGARKILNDIIDNQESSDLVVRDSRELLDSII